MPKEDTNLHTDREETEATQRILEENQEKEEEEVMGKKTKSLIKIIDGFSATFREGIKSLGFKDVERAGSKAEKKIRRKR